MSQNETIVACATPPGYSSIAVIRLSGAQAVSILQQIFRPKQIPETYSPQRVYFGTVIDPQNDEPVDTALVAPFFGPDSYTGEDVVEISCHGNPLIVERIIRLLLGLGARSARPGEFTKRALLNGKIDLIQAEAVLDTVQATCEQARRQAFMQYEGKLSARIHDIRSRIVDVLLRLEAGIDFGEEEGVEPDPAALAGGIAGTVELVDELLNGASAGVKIREGYKILIAGRANVGKSTLFNRLVGYDRAIVHEQPGTTRDFLAEGVQMGDLYARLYDTAGILRAAAGPDQIAQQRTKALIQEADLILMMFDGSEPMNEEDVYLYNLLKHRPKLLIVNKVDLNVRLSGESILSDSIKISARTGENVEALIGGIGRVLLSGVQEHRVMLTRHRHIDGLTRARRFLVDAKNAGTMETMAYELHCALDEIGELTGKVLRQEILDRIFEAFCIGK